VRTGSEANRGLTYSLTLTSYFQAVRAVTSFLAPPGNLSPEASFLQGSVLWDRRTEAVSGVAPVRRWERSGLFRPRVSRRERQLAFVTPGEPPIINARVLIGSLSARSDSDGSYHVWDLVPFEPVHS